MITIESVLAKKNIKRALNKLKLQDDDFVIEKPKDSTVQYYSNAQNWINNQHRIISSILDGTYEPEFVTEYEIVSNKGKKRAVTSLGYFDKIITRLIAQKLNDFYNPRFFQQSYAYQYNKGIQLAAEKAREHIESGKELTVEIDIKSFFDEISIELLLEKLGKETKDEKVLNLIKKYLYCTVIKDGKIIKKKKGIVQGSPISPVLSNIYLHDFDCFLEDRQYKWLRFADNINVYVDNIEQGEIIFRQIKEKLSKDFKLELNEQKSGIFNVFSKTLLGFEFHKKGNAVIVEKHKYQKQNIYAQWHPSVIKKVNEEYHILKGGILNKKDFSLLFENPDEKHHIPVEATEQINIYNDIILPGNVIRTLFNQKIRLCIYDKYGNLTGTFIPESYYRDSKTVLAQCNEYSNLEKRIKSAKILEIAAIHNIRANLRYYKKQNKDLTAYINELSLEIQKIKACKTIEHVLLIEGRCRKSYYEAFNTILQKPDFYFEKRTKQPPEDCINALISFGNTLLYNRIQQIIWKTSLDSRIGILHAANKRHYSLNLDFADLFKPVITDRIIFTLINKGQLQKDMFVKHAKEGIPNSVYLSDEGKKMFIQAFDEKLKSRLTVKQKSLTYLQLIEAEVHAYLDHLLQNNEYKPYKYY
ncbi:MAG: CRISPR-associated endonuclease Cas1 [Treponemataceae bacterium]|nr:CRISPR-associated endonuclease Cas1 [Treponemataceae bacterium]